MKKIIAAAICFGTLALTAVDASAASRRECEIYATDYANSVTRPAGQALAGGLIGAGVGAVIGGIAGNRPGVGAAIGAGVGAGVGLGANNPRWQAAYNEAYRDCRNDGGSRGRLEPWTRAWYNACSDRYRSFDPDTGTWIDRNGNERFCEL